ncbi:MAG TPA: hypothetical protein VIH72_05410 [Candidatus Acidoferrales bacterium]
MTKNQWRIAAKILQYGGGIAFIIMFIALTTLTVYYKATRPPQPKPEYGWTQGLSWTYPGVYGTPKEESHLQSLFTWLALPFGLVVVGEGIRIRKLGVDPPKLNPMIFGKRYR